MQPQKQYDQFRAKDGTVIDRDGNVVKFGRPEEDHRNEDGNCTYCERLCCRHTGCGNCTRCLGDVSERQ